TAIWQLPPGPRVAGQLLVWENGLAVCMEVIGTIVCELLVNVRVCDCPGIPKVVGILRARGEMPRSAAIMPVARRFTIWVPPGPKFEAVKVPAAYWLVSGE